MTRICIERPGRPLPGLRGDAASLALLAAPASQHQHRRHGAVQRIERSAHGDLTGRSATESPGHADDRALFVRRRAGGGAQSSCLLRNARTSTTSESLACGSIATGADSRGAGSTIERRVHLPADQPHAGVQALPYGQHPDRSLSGDRSSDRAKPGSVAPASEDAVGMARKAALSRCGLLRSRAILRFDLRSMGLRQGRRSQPQVVARPV